MPKIAAVTGHRPDKLGGEYDLKGPYSGYIRDQLRQEIELYNIETAISGMALGVDTLWALLALDMGLNLTAAIPFKGQESRWPEKSKKVFNDILSHPRTKQVIVSDGGYGSWKMQVRNVWMVDHCDILFAVWDGTKGGTGNCVEYARKVHRKMDIIKPDGWKKFSREEWELED